MGIVPNTGSQTNTALRVGDYVVHKAPCGSVQHGRVVAIDPIAPEARVLVDISTGTRACFYPGFCTKVPAGWAQ